jgi:hypothetical protein
MDVEESPELEHAVKCKECTIYIGPGFTETRPISAPDGRGYYCWRCYESYLRQEERRAARARAGESF